MDFARDCADIGQGRSGSAVSMANVIVELIVLGSEQTAFVIVKVIF